MMSLLNLTSENFDAVISRGRVFVDFWAEWCMPCRVIAPIINELALEYDGTVTVAKVDVDNESALAARYDIKSIPTVIMFNDGLEFKRLVGVQPKEAYENELTIDN